MTHPTDRLSAAADLVTAADLVGAADLVSAADLVGAADLVSAADLVGAADLVSAVDRSVPDLAVPAGAFGADDAGMPGRVGRELHAHWDAILAARSREAAEVAARLRDLASSVRATAQGYAEADESAARRFEAI